MNPSPLEWTVARHESGQRLLAFLSTRLIERHSIRAVKRLIENRRCKINGRIERFAAIPVKEGERISVWLDMPIGEEKYRQKVSILYEDDALCLCHKPAGITSDADGIGALLHSHCHPLHVVHRLDRETTGVLILAKREEVKQALIQQFRTFQVEKRYIAIVDGIVSDVEGRIENEIGKRGSYSGQTIWGEVAKGKGLAARTDWERLATGMNCTLLACFPRTGRTHQLRVHLAELGHPILGDSQYGRQFQCNYPATRPLLHAESIAFYHPCTEKWLSVRAPLPSDMKEAKQMLFGN